MASPAGCPPFLGGATICVSVSWVISCLGGEGHDIRRRSDDKHLKKIIEKQSHPSSRHFSCSNADRRVHPTANAQNFIQFVRHPSTSAVSAVGLAEDRRNCRACRRHRARRLARRVHTVVVVHLSRRHVAGLGTAGPPSVHVKMSIAHPSGDETRAPDPPGAVLGNNRKHWNAQPPRGPIRLWDPASIMDPGRRDQGSQSDDSGVLTHRRAPKRDPGGDPPMQWSWPERSSLLTDAERDRAAHAPSSGRARWASA